MSAATTRRPVALLGAWAILLAVLILLASASGVGAYTQMYRFQYCSAIVDDVARLSCYDDYALELGLPPPDEDSLVSATQRHLGQWTIRTEAFSPDHAAAIFAFTDGELVLREHAGVFSAPTLVTRCFDRKTELYIGFGTPVSLKAGGNEPSILYVENPANAKKAAEKGVLSLKAKEQKQSRVMVELVLGDREPITAMLTPSRDGRALFFSNPVSLIRQMKLSPFMRFIYRKGDLPNVDVMFSLDGMQESIAPLRDSCGW